MATTAATLLARVRAQVVEAAAGFWTDDVIYDYLSEGQRVLALRLPDDCLVQLSKLNSAAGTFTSGVCRFYDDTGDNEILDFLRLKMLVVNYGTGDRVATLVDPLEALHKVGQYSSEEAIEEDPFCYIWNRSLYAFPTTFTSSDVFYIANPVTITVDVDPTIDDQYASLVVEWALFRGFERAREITQMMAHQQAFEGAMKDIWQIHNQSLKMESRRGK